jgi:hypothetical protein
MTEDDDFDLDFRPFFDLAMGVLFVMLILLASQFLVAQVTSTTEAEAVTAQRLLEKRRQADREIGLFFDHAEEVAGRQGVPIEVDRAGRRIVLRSTGAGDDQFAAAASVFQQVFGCANDRRGQACPDYKVIKLEEAEIDGSGMSAPEAATLPSDARARLQGWMAFANLVRISPDLLALRSTDGALLMRQGEPAASAPVRGDSPALHNGADTMSVRVVIRSR